mgnify:CR=1 FL=1
MAKVVALNTNQTNAQEKGEPKKPELKKRVRRVKIMQYEKNPVTGEPLNFNEENITKGLETFSHRALRWAWVCHDKDVVTMADFKDSIIDENYRYKMEDLGKPKGTHWHIVLDLKNPAMISAIAKAFGVPENFVETIEGSTKTHDGVLDCIYYLTHEDDRQQEYGKHTYGREEVHISDPVIWEAIDIQNEREALKKGGIKADVRVMVDKITKGLTLTQAYKVDEIMFVENRQLFKTARQEYLKNSPTPAVRTNYFITGGGGTGKSLSAKVFARSIRPDIDNDEELFFVVGDGNVPFDGYDGQPIIIWDDWRAKDLLDKFDRSLIWKLFAINPERIDVNVKYGSTRLINTVNIVTSVQSYHDFNNTLSGEYRDKKGVVHLSEDRAQAYRRFPFFIEVTKQVLTIAKVQGLSDDEMNSYMPLIRFENNMFELQRHQEKGRRIDVANYLGKPLDVINDVTNDYQSRGDEELKPLGDFIELEEEKEGK